MVQIYSPDNTEYDKNGDAVLDPISCEAEINLNGSWELTLEVTIDDADAWIAPPGSTETSKPGSYGKFHVIEHDAVICVDTPVGDNQLWRIYETQRTNDSVIAYARPIFMDSANDVFLVDSRPTDMTAQQALDYIMQGTKYSGESDLIITATAYYVRKNLIEAIAGSDDNSILNRWGGEISYNNYKVSVMNQLGSDNGLRVEFGRNIESIEETVDMSDVCTRAVPQAFNGYTLEGDEPWVDSPLINAYPIVYTKVLEFSDMKLAEDVNEGSEDDDSEVYETLEELRAAMIARVQQLYLEGLDLPKITYDIDMVDLRNTDEYAKYTDLETINLGDTVHCYHRRLGIETEARVIKYLYDCVLKRITEITIGDPTEDYLDKINDIVSSSGGTVDLSRLQAQYDYIIANYVRTDTLEARLGTFESVYTEYLEVLYESVNTLEAALIDVNTLLADKASIADLDVVVENVDDLTAIVATVEGTLDATIANIADLSAITAQVVTLLGGDITAGEITSIYLAAGTTVIETAVVEEALLGTVLADIITSNVIYTDYITIMNNEGGNFVINGSTLQISDGTTVRIQMGLDEYGNYNYYIVNEDGDIIWDALGLTEAGLIGNGAIIKDIAIADDAAIQGSKLDIASVAECLNADGSLILQASQVYIGDEGLSIVLAQMQQQIDSIDPAEYEKYGICDVQDWFCVTDSDEAPDLPEDTRAYAEVFALGKSILGNTEMGGGWVTEQPTADEGQYLWTVTEYICYDGTVIWGAVRCMTDAYVRASTTTLLQEFEVMNGHVESLIAQVTTIEGDVEGISSQFNLFYQDYETTIDSISSSVALATEDASYARETADNLVITVNEFQNTITDEVQILVGEYELIWSDISYLYQSNTEIYQGLVHVEELIEGLETDGLLDFQAYYALSDSPDVPPDGDAYDDRAYAAIFALGVSILGNTENSSAWTTEKLTGTEGINLLSLYESYSSSAVIVAASYVLSLNAYGRQYAGNTTVTLSFDARVSGEGGLNIENHLDGSGTLIAAISLTDEWTHYEFTFDVADLVDNPSVYIYNGEWGNLRYFKLEVGSKATDFNTGTSLKYVWIRWRKVHVDGSVTWTDPELLTDAYVNAQWSYIHEELDDVKIQVGDISEAVATIEVKVDNIKLSVVSTDDGSNAIIDLGVGDTAYVLPQGVRNAFADDDSYVYIGAGTVEFEAGTFLVSSQTFNITGYSVITSSDYLYSVGTIATTMEAGKLTFSYRNEYLGLDSADIYMRNTTEYGIVLNIESDRIDLRSKSGTGSVVILPDTVFIGGVDDDPRGTAGVQISGSISQYQGSVLIGNAGNSDNYTFTLYWGSRIYNDVTMVTNDIKFQSMSGSTHGIYGQIASGDYSRMLGMQTDYILAVGSTDATTYIYSADRIAISNSVWINSNEGLYVGYGSSIQAVWAADGMLGFGPQSESAQVYIWGSSVYISSDTTINGRVYVGSNSLQAIFTYQNQLGFGNQDNPTEVYIWGNPVYINKDLRVSGDIYGSYFSGTAEYATSAGSASTAANATYADYLTNAITVEIIANGVSRSGSGTSSISVDITDLVNSGGSSSTEAEYLYDSYKYVWRASASDTVCVGVSGDTSCVNISAEEVDIGESVSGATTHLYGYVIQLGYSGVTEGVAINSSTISINGTINTNLTVSTSSSRQISIRGTDSSAEASIQCIHQNTNGVMFGVGAGGSNRGIYDLVADRWIIYADGDNNTNINGATVNIGGSGSGTQTNIIGELMDIQSETFTLTGGDISIGCSGINVYVEIGSGARTIWLGSYATRVYLGGQSASSAAEYVYIQGTQIYASGSTWVASDRSIKEDVKQLNISENSEDDNLIDEIDKLEPVQYHLTNNPNDTEIHYGYIADDVQKVMPELVRENDDGLKCLGYTEIIPLLHLKIKSLEERIKQLESANS